MSTYSPSLLEIKTDKIGIEQLLDYYSFYSFRRQNGCKLDLTSIDSMDANLSAIVLALNRKLALQFGYYPKLTVGSGQGIFFRNGLISHINGDGNNNKYPDDRDSTVPLRTYGQNEYDDFERYIGVDFLKHRSVEHISHALKKDLKHHYLEIFTNVGLHANTSEAIFTCGQYFPAQSILKFTLVDIGDGFLPPINRATSGKITDSKTSIVWAATDFNSTKDPQFGPGGSGLKELRTFCDKNNGSLQICSGDGYVTFIKGKAIEQKLKHKFPGAIVNVILRGI